MTLKEKLQLELNDVDSKINKLDYFINGDLYSSVNQTQQSLLRVQLSAMITYRDCLKERLKTL